MILAGDLLATDVGAEVSLSRFGIRGRLDALEQRGPVVDITVDGVPLTAFSDELVAIDRGDSPSSRASRAAQYDADVHSLLSRLARKAHS